MVGWLVTVPMFSTPSLLRHTTVLITKLECNIPCLRVYYSMPMFIGYYTSI